MQQAIKLSGLRREDVFISEYSTFDSGNLQGLTLPPSASKITAKLQGYQETLDAVEASLARLDTSFIDLFLLHDPLAGSEKRLASYRALAEKQKEGKLIDIGVSNFGVCHLKELLASGAGPKPAVNQIEVRRASLLTTSTALTDPCSSAGPSALPVPRHCRILPVARRYR